MQIEIGSRRRSVALDVLRAVAVLLVLGRHVFRFPTSPLLADFVYVWCRGGWIGVDLFFVLSGFLISGLLFQEYTRHGEIRVGRFLLRRGFKVYPAFYLFWAITIGYDKLTHAPPRWAAAVSEALFVQNYCPSMWPHTWSLAVEEHFYLTLPLLLLWLGRRAGRRDDPFFRLPVVVVGVAIVALILRVSAGLDGEYEFSVNHTPTHLRLDSLLFGVLLSYWSHFHSAAFNQFFIARRYTLLTIGLLLILPAFVWELGHARLLTTFGFTALYLGSGLLLGVAVTAQGFSRNPIARSVAALGAYSYSIYLWHIPVSHWLMPWIVNTTGLASRSIAILILYLVLAVSVGVVMAYIVELPMLRLRDRLFPSRSAAAP